MCSPPQDSKTFAIATIPSGKPEEGRGRCPYDPYQKNTAITVGKNSSTAMSIKRWHRLSGLFHTAYLRDYLNVEQASSLDA